MILNNLFTKFIISVIAIGLSSFSQFNETIFNDYDAKIKAITLLEKFNFTTINSFQSFNSECNQTSTQLIKSNTYVAGANDLRIYSSNDLRINAFIWMEMLDNIYCNTPFVRNNHTNLMDHEAIISRNLANRYQLSVGDQLDVDLDSQYFSYQVVDIIEPYYGHNLMTIEQHRDGLLIIGNNELVFNTITPSAKNLLIGFSNLGTSNSLKINESIDTIRNSTNTKEIAYSTILILLWIIFSIIVSFNYSSNKMNIHFYGDIDLGMAYRYKFGFQNKHLFWLFIKFEIPLLFILLSLIGFFYLIGSFALLRMATLTILWVGGLSTFTLFIKNFIVIYLTK